MSLFKDAVDKRAAEGIAFKPSATIGFGIDTSQYLKTELKNNPYFLSINNISPNHALKLIADASKHGMSFVTKKPGANKDLYVHINPKTVGGIAGGQTGKTETIQADPGSVTIGELLHPGDNQQTPTVIKANVYSKNPLIQDNNTTANPLEVAKNTLPEQSDGDPNVGPRPNLAVPPDPTNPFLNPNLSNQGNSNATSNTATLQDLINQGQATSPSFTSPNSSTPSIPSNAPRPNSPGPVLPNSPVPNKVTPKEEVPFRPFPQADTAAEAAKRFNSSGLQARVKQGNSVVQTAFSADLDKKGRPLVIKAGNGVIPVSVEFGLGYSGDNLRTGTLLIAGTELSKYTENHVNLTDLFP